MKLDELMLGHLVSDPTDGIIGSRIILQFDQLLGMSDLSQEKRQEANTLQMILAMKLVSIWNHYDRYSRHESEAIAAGQRDPIDLAKGRREPLKYGQVLYIELDGFVVQIKSALDHVAKFLHFGFGLPYLNTFGEKGRKVINTLRRVGRNHSRGQQNLAHFLIAMIEKNINWLQAVIDLRDKLNHYQDGGIGMAPFVVAVVKELDGAIHVHRPEIEGVAIKDIMDDLWKNIIGLTEVFVGACLSAQITRVGLKYFEQENPIVRRWYFMKLVDIPRGDDGNPLPGYVDNF